VSDAARKLQWRVVLVYLIAPPAGAVAAALFTRAYGLGALEICLFAGMYLATGVGITVGFHRCFAHRSFVTGPRTRALLAVLGSMSAQGPLLYWVSSHRKHHRYADQEGDPHSPNLAGTRTLDRLKAIWHAHVGWAFIPQDVADWENYAPDVLRDPIGLWVTRRYLLFVAAGLLLPAVVGGLVTGTWQGLIVGLLWGGLVRLFISQHLTYSINSLCHLVGSRPYPTRDRSTNVFWLALPTLGESWHNNHHAFSTSANLGLRWWHPDPGFWVIRLLGAVGLAWDVKGPTTQADDISYIWARPGQVGPPSRGLRDGS
jgi:stearoyl-CoA desaturase (delta-9 desaturase)